MSRLVSILIPAYNAENWIRQTLQSAVAQTYPNTEIIVVNDGSTDKTLQIAKSFESRRIKIVDQPNAGSAAARNTALAHAQGDYFQWLDHDDLLAPDKISQQMNQAASISDDRILFTGNFGTFYFNPRRAKLATGPLGKDLTPLDYFYIKFEQDEWLHTTCWLVSRKLSDLAGPWLDIRSPDDDGEYFCRVVASSTRVVFVPTAMSYWRVGNVASFSHSRQKSVTSLRAMIESTRRCIAQFRALEDSDRSRKACVTFIHNRLIYYYPDRREMLAELEAMAKELGGTLSTPPLSSKFELVRKLFGWKMAVWATFCLPNVRTFAVKTWDKLMFDLSPNKSVTPKCTL
jgi:glycosyltransferase involved in cell wall biosynthesis